MTTSTTSDRPTPTADTAAELRATVDHMYRAWDRNDAAAYAAFFTDDSDYVAFDGTRLRGRAANEALHARLFAGVLRGTRIVGEVDDIRVLTPDVALLHTHGAVLFPWQDRAPRSRASIQTMVAVRTQDGWRFSAFHNTRVRPIPQDGWWVRAFAWFVRMRTAAAQASAPASV
jgi:uncharacterized protein (TIGR02246 family)